jgi:hypothetical protein
MLEGDLARDRSVGGDPIAVEGREHEPPDAQVLGAVGEEDRARAGHRAQRPRARAALGDRRIGAYTARTASGCQTSTSGASSKARRMVNASP